jgi:hypothetical protein
MSANSADCYWKGTSSEVDALVSNPPAEANKPLVCGTASYNSLEHWCNIGMKQLNPTSNKIPAATLSKWTPVNTRKQGESNLEWMGRIYDAMIGDPVGTRKSAPWEGGVSASAGNLGTLNTLNSQVATALCENPCYWYYNHPNTPTDRKNKVDGAGLCNCKDTTHPSINYQRIRYYMRNNYLHY